MTELNRGEFVVNADGGLMWCGSELGGMHKRLPHEVSAGSIATLIRNGYKRVFHEAAESLNFPSGSVVLTDGSQITGRIEPAPEPASMTPTLDKLEATAEPQRAPLPHFNQRTPFDTFGPGFKVRSDTGWMTGEDGHPLQRMTADSPTHGSAHLLLSKTA